MRSNPTTDRPFQFDLDRAIQCVACLLRREHGHRMNYMRLLKLLYIAERETLRDAGKPLTGSPVVAMQRGPVLETVYALVRGQHLATPEWSNFFAVDGYRLEMIADPGLGRLSRFITEKLEEITERHRNDDEWRMVEICHSLPEWRKNDPGTSSKQIPLPDILEAVGRGDDLSQIVKGAQEDYAASRFFSETE